MYSRALIWSILNNLNEEDNLWDTLKKMTGLDNIEQTENGLLKVIKSKEFSKAGGTKKLRHNIKK